MSKAKSAKGPLLVRLRTGEDLQIAKLGMSGYIAAPIGALILGGSPSRDMVGKFAVGVEYEDGDTGLIAQEEIVEILDPNGDSIDFGNARYPGHPQYDPRDGFDPEEEAFRIMKRNMEQKWDKNQSTLNLKVSNKWAAQDSDNSFEELEAKKKKGKKKSQNSKSTEKAAKKKKKGKKKSKKKKDKK